MSASNSHPQLGQDPGHHVRVVAESDYSAASTTPLDAADALGDQGDEKLLTIEGLKVHFETREGVVKAVDGIDLAVPRGRTVCLVGESGCGKTITGRSVLQLVDPPGKIVAGKIRWSRGVGPDQSPSQSPETAPGTSRAEIDLATLDPRGEDIRAIRGRRIGMVFQEPMASMSPMYTVGTQLMEAIRLHHALSKREAYERAVGLLRQVRVPQPERRMDSYSFELSGGLCQRAMLAIALSCDPALLIADEPTTALDVTTQARILDLLMELKESRSMAMLFITHDLGVVSEIADDVSVMYLGSIVEAGSVEQILAHPQHPYTQALLRSVPTMGAADARLPAIRGMVPHPNDRPDGCPFHTRCDSQVPGLCDRISPPTVDLGRGQLVRCHLHDSAGRSAAAAAGVNVELIVNPRLSDRQYRSGATSSTATTAPAAHEVVALLDLQDVTVHFPVRRGGLFGRTIGHLRAVDGVDLTIRSGETVGLVGESGCGKTTLGRCILGVVRPTAGSVRYRPGTGESVDLATLPTRALRQYRGEIRMVFQDPFSSLNPRMTLLDLVGEPLRNCGIARGSELQDRVAHMLTKVGLRPEYMRRYPHAFSGGERQRINIARALVTQPRLVVADEPVSALDVSVRAQIINLLEDLREEFDLTYLFISHDLSVVEHICDRAAVMYLGKIAEIAPTAELFRAPRHPYTEALLSAVPVIDTQRQRSRVVRLAEDLPDAMEPPPGCRFHTRCPHRREQGCDSDVPPLRELAEDQHVACHYADELQLVGIEGRR